jgi:hypothetical protein
LEGNAALLFKNCKDALTYEKLREKLKAPYGSEQQYAKHRQELRNRRQKKGESLESLAFDIERLVALGYPNTPTDERALETFLEAIEDGELRFFVQKEEPTTLTQALRLAQKIAALREHNADKETAKPKNVRATQHEDAAKEDGNRRESAPKE